MIFPWEPLDREGAIAVVREVFDEYHFTWDEHEYHADLYDVGGYYLARGNSFYVAKTVDRVVGTCALEVFDPIPGEIGSLINLEGMLRIGGADCSLERLYVRPESRKTGVGGSLARRIIGEAKLRGCRNMEIWSDKRFEAAHRLYQRLGAIPVGERICDDPDLSPEYGLLVPLGLSK